MMASGAAQASMRDVVERVELGVAESRDSEERAFTLQG